MKRFIAIFAAAMICLSCAACGCTNSEPATMPSSNPTLPSTMPNTILPTMETNIPDPEVNDNSTIGMDATGTTNATDGANGSGITGNDGSSAERNRSMTGGMK